VSLRQLLTMTSGVGWREDYHDPASPASWLLRRWHEGDGGLRESLLDMPPGDPPGSRYAYCTPDSLALDWARERATGETFAAALAGLWSAIEAEHPALIGLDRPAEHGGIAMAGGSLAATARAFLRALNRGGVIVALLIAVAVAHYAATVSRIDWRRALWLSSPVLVSVLWFEALSSHTQFHLTVSSRSAAVAIAIVLSATVMSMPRRPSLPELWAQLQTLRAKLPLMRQKRAGP